MKQTGKRPYAPFGVLTGCALLALLWKRVYASCGAGFIAVIRQIDADRYETEAKIPTVKLARTSLFDPKSGRLYQVVPRHGDSAGPEIWVYQAQGGES